MITDYETTDFQLGLYRHFRGDYFFTLSLVRECKGYEVCVRYVNVLYPTVEYVRPLEEFYKCSYDRENGCPIADRKDNVTGQIYRFERVTDLNNFIKDISTETLMKELSSRSDSPLQDLDIKGVSNKVFSRDYCIGVANEERVDPRTGATYPRGVYTLNAFTTLEEAKKYREHGAKNHNSDERLFKRVFIEIEE